ncbi:RNA pyrophosphohydrolase [Candidatus Methylomicrobium oryzae]|uniref:RNA pyrophosphohydrolase n=1 Tax=Candidatus Methylomicrobium oryzae TaxID=2802053 RepID=UPI001920DE3A|nr:RNA pyrophosphohydrolase [Methylomicrobium sp. RS1]MBL1262987.1 RNA pyrophosphohydrolase [Methylomicrobium sp. RS1]
MIDSKGYRPNVGIILCNDEGRVFWAKRMGMNAWQFPQGGINQDEDPETAMYRELWEETGLQQQHVQVLGRTRYWLRYKLPERYIRKNTAPICIGQKQIWFILRLLTHESNVRFDHCPKPEFDSWRWVDYWEPLKDVVYFKRKVYLRAMTELSEILAIEGLPVDMAGKTVKDQMPPARLKGSRRPRHRKAAAKA